MITSLENKTVKELTKLHQKKYREDKFLLLNEKIVSLAYETNNLDTLIYCDEKPFEFEKCIEVSREVLNKISKKVGLNYVGIGKHIVENYNYGNKVIILDHLQDPLNIGRIMEAAYLFGFDSVILSQESADIYNDKCIENCKGAIFKLKISHKNLSEEVVSLQNKGYKVYATGLKNETKSLNDIKPIERVAIILGNEGSGVDPHLMDICDETIKIDMVNIDSLNVGMAGSIIMYHFSK